MSIHVGIGSWGDDAYVGVLYPPGLPKADRLHDYARSLRHVEVNASYYATPKPAVVRGWLKQTPADFTFSVKLHRAFSQSPAKAAENSVLMKRLRDAVRPLVAAQRLGCLLLVLPPRFAPDRHRLEELDPLVRKLRGIPFAVELRHRDWVTGKHRAETLRFYRERELIWVAVDLPRLPASALMPPVDEVTHPTTAYLRLHGRNPAYLAAGSTSQGHHYAYTTREIAELAARVKKFSRKAREIFVIANNHADDFAPKTALALQAKLGLGKRPKPPPRARRAASEPHDPIAFHRGAAELRKS